VQRRDGGDSTVRVRAAQLDVLTCTDLPGEVRDSTAQEARAEIESEHERGVGYRLEEQRAVARPVRAARSLAHQAGILERAKRQRDRRLRNAHPTRDLRPRDRRPGSNRLEHGPFVEMLQ
jgi:hypothetical protein